MFYVSVMAVISITMSAKKIVNYSTKFMFEYIWFIVRYQITFGLFFQGKLQGWYTLCEDLRNTGLLVAEVTHTSQSRSELSSSWNQAVIAV